MKLLPIRSVGVFSLANFAAAYCALAGVITTAVQMLDKPNKLSVPLGILFPLLHLKLTYLRPESAAGNILQLLLFMAVYGLSGWLTGLVGATAYNLLSKYFNVYIKGCVDAAATSNPVSSR